MFEYIFMQMECGTLVKRGQKTTLLRMKCCL